MARSAREQIGVDLPDPVHPEAEAQPQVEEKSSRPEWLPEQFKDETEFVASYKEAERKIKEQGDNQKVLQNQIDNLTEALQNLDSRPEPVTSAQPDANQLRDQLMTAYENDPIGTMAYLAQQYAGQIIDQRLQTLQEQNNPAAMAQVEAQNQLLAMTVDRALGDRYADWGEYKERVAAEIESDNNLLPERALADPQMTVNALSRVYELVKAREILAGQTTNNDNFVTHQMKVQAQTVPGSLGRPGEPSPEEEKQAALIAAARNMSYSSWRGAS